MKKEVSRAVILWGLALLILFATLPMVGAKNLYSSLIRIHVLAHSDDEKDQEMKLEVRDALLQYARENFSEETSLSAVKSEIEEKIPELERVAEDCLKERGCKRPVTVSLTEEYYNTRHYDALSLPAGRYLSLQVKIGQAQGKNWWCVFFPPLCLNSAVGAQDALLDAGMKEENVKTVTQNGKKYQVRFKILELFHMTKEKLEDIF